MDPQWPWAKDHLGPPGGPKDAWLVHNGSLYINFFPAVRKIFASDLENHIKVANDRWSKWWGGLKAGPFNFMCGPWEPIGVPSAQRSPCWVPGTQPEQPDCCVQTPQLPYNMSI